MSAISLLKQLKNLPGVAISAEIGADGGLHAVGGEYAKLVAALFTRAVPRIHTVVFARAQDLASFDLVRDGRFSRPNFFRERQPEREFVVITAESLAQAIELIHLRQDQMKAGDLSGNLPRRNPDFVGRERFFGHLEEWIRETPCGYLVLEGGVGIGKTTLLGEYVHRLIGCGELPVRHFIGYQPDATGQPDAIARSLYQQLRIKYAILEPEDWQGLSAGDRLQRLLREQVAPQLNGRKEVLFLDAADQAGVAAAEFLVPGALRDLPQGVLCVITSRHQLAWLGTRENLTPWDWGTTWEDESARWDREDIGTYLSQQNQRYGLGLPETFIGEIISQSRPPVFYTVRKHVDQVRQPTLSGPDPRELRTDVALWLLPAEELIDRILMRAEAVAISRGVKKHDFWETLGLLTLADEPLSPEQLQDLGAWRGTFEEVLTLTADVFKPRPLLPAPRQPYEFDHPGCVRQILRHLSTPEQEHCHSLLASGCEAWGNHHGAARDYALQHRLAHWLAAREWDRFADVFADAEFIVERCRRFQFADVHADALRAAQHDRITPDWKAAFDELERFLRFRIERLRAFPSSYAQEICNEFLSGAKARDPLASQLRRVGDDVTSWASPVCLRKVFGPPTLTATGHTGSVSSVAFSPDGRWVASGGDDRTVKVWEAATGRRVADCSGHTDLVSSVAFSPDGRWVASGGDDGTVKVWEAATGRRVADCSRHTGGVSSVAFSPDGRWIASGSGDGTVKVWELDTLAVQGDSRVSTLFYERVPRAVAFTVNMGRVRLLVGDEGGQAFGYEVVSG